MRGFIAFLVYVIVELTLVFWIASLFGWLLVSGLVVAGLAFGLVIMKNAGTQAAAVLREGSRTGKLPEGGVGDSGLLFAAGGLIFIPGFVTDIIGILLLLPPVRKLTRRWGAGLISRRLRAQGMSVVTTTVDGKTVTRVVPGDVVAGDVIRRTDDAPGTTPPTNGPRKQLPRDDRGQPG